MELNSRSNLFAPIRNKRDPGDPPNVVHLLNARQLGFTKKKSSYHLKQFAELKTAAAELKETRCQLPQSARSTFLMTFSHDCTKVASTHGDHNIYVSDIKTGKHLHKLEGHPRTPWCIAFHPTSNDILASGCLAGEVRVWDLHGGSEKWRVDHDQVIASLTFHPFLQMLVIATGSCLYFWDWSQPKPAAYCSTNSELERVRYVKFDHYGHRLITGISNVNACAGGLLNSSSAHYDSNEDIFRTSRRGIMDRWRSMPDYETANRRQTPSANRSPSVSPPPRRRSRNLIFPRNFADEVRRIVAETLDESMDAHSHGDLLEDLSPMSSPGQPPTSDLESNESLPGTTNSETQNESRTNDENNDSSDQPDDESVASGEVRNTFDRLRSLCSDLELQLLSNAEEERNEEEAEEAAAQSANSSDLLDFQEDDDSLLEHEFAPPYTPLIDMLGRIRMAVHFSTLSLTALRDQINQVRSRISEILPRIRYYSGRIPNGHMHRQIFQGMTTQLTDQLERLLQADERLVNTIDFPTSISASTSEIFGQSSSIADLDIAPLEQLSANIAEELQSLSSTVMASTSAQSSSSAQPSSVLPSLSSTQPSSPPLSSTSELPSISSELPPSPSEHSYSTASGQSPDERHLTWRDALISLPTISWSQSAPGRSVNNNSENPSRRSTSTARLTEYFPRHRFNPISVRRNFRRNLSSQFSSNNTRRTNRRSAAQSVESDDESLSSTNVRPLPRLTMASRRRNVARQSEEPPSPDPAQRPEAMDMFGLHNVQIDPISDVSSDESDRPSTPPLNYQAMYPPPYSNMLSNGNSRIALGDPLTQNHRIQMWNFSPFRLPAIYDSTANIVVRRCMIHNDASVDISQDGEKLVAIIPPDETEPDRTNLRLGVYCLKKRTLGRTLCLWGHISNAISVSFSPLAQYVVVGSACSRPAFLSTEKTPVVQIIKIHPGVEDSFYATYIRSFTQTISNENRFQPVSLNCVKYLPRPGLGIAYATNRGCLCICKPVAGQLREEEEETRTDDDEILRTLTTRTPAFRAFMRQAREEIS